MQLETLRFGMLDIEEERIVRFPLGLPGFEQYHDYYFLQPDPDLPLSYMQCVNDGYISFVVMDPFLVLPSYEFELTDSVKEELKLSEANDVTILSIVTIKEEIRSATINLKAPIVINTRACLGKQVILHDHNYVTKHPLFAHTDVEPSGTRGR